MKNFAMYILHKNKVENNLTKVFLCHINSLSL
jgi:hypothetical protein